ncbi:uncharacterized protein LOC133527111 [Cydia pomonella]|uniref:uncharacterized protein LOC133527111 n=1 Tax=Cydia pomonella TaxID=82600 RepID=UPI002ADDBFD4|nr:uncharacterized protein LOC133527111 [Cydia pomonella]
MAGVFRTPPNTPKKLKKGTNAPQNIPSTDNQNLEMATGVADGTCGEPAERLAELGDSPRQSAPPGLPPVITITDIPSTLDSTFTVEKIISNVRPTSPISALKAQMPTPTASEPRRSGSTEMERLLWTSRDSNISSPGTKTRADRYRTEIERHAENITAQLTQNKSVTKLNKGSITKSVEAILEATRRFTSELEVLGVAHVEPDVMSTRTPGPVLDPVQLKNDIIAGVQVELTKMRAEQQAINDKVLAAINEDKREEVGSEKETFATVVSRKNRMKYRSEAAAAAAAAAAGGTIEEDDLTSPAVGRPYKPKPSRTNVPPSTNFVVVLESIDPRQEGKDVLKVIKEKVDVVDIGVGIKSVRETRNKKVIISCDSNEDRQKLSTAIKTQTTNITVGIPKMRNPSLRIIGVIPEYASAKIEDAMIKQNVRLLDGIADEHKTVRYVRAVKGRNDSVRNAIVEVSPQMWTAMQGQKVRIGYQSVMAVDQSPVLQCFKCFGFGHRASECKSDARCAYCAEHHDTRSCNNRETVSRCVNCVNRNCNERDCMHSAFSQTCPEWIKWDRNKTTLSSIDGYDIYQYSDTSNRTKACIAIRKKLGNYIGITQYMTANFSPVLLTFGNKKVLLSSVYVEPGEDPSNTLNHLEHVLREYPNIDHIICGDMNGWHTSWGSVRNNDRGKDIYDLIVTNDLAITNVGNEPTFEKVTHGQTRYSIVDLTLTTIGIARNIEEWKVNHGIVPSSDHHGIEFQINLNIERNNKKVSLSTYKYNTERVKWENFVDKLKENIQRSELENTDIDNLNPNDIDIYIANLTKCITKTCDKVLCRKKPHIKIPWWTEELTNMKKKVIRLHHRLQDLKRGRKDLTNILRELSEARTEYAQLIRATSNNHFRDFCTSQGKDDVWTVTNRLLKSGPQPQPPSTLKIHGNTYTLTTQDTAAKLAAKFFPDDTPAQDTAHHLQQRNNAQIINNIHENNNIIDEPPFTTPELIEVINSMSPKRAPGMDSLTADICKQEQCSTTDALNRAVNNIKHYKSKQKLVVAISLDIEGAFDHAWWPALLSRLRAVHCPRNIYNIIYSYLTDRKVVLNYADATTLPTIGSIALAGLTPLPLKVKEVASREITKRTRITKYLPEDILYDKRVPVEELLHPAKRTNITITEVLTQEDLDPFYSTEMNRIFTDGSKHDDAVGAAVVIYHPDGRETTRKYKLHSSCTVFQAECLAIEQACQLCFTLGLEQSTVFSDSKSALNELMCRSSTNTTINSAQKATKLLTLLPNTRLCYTRNLISINSPYLIILKTFEQTLI